MRTFPACTVKSMRWHECLSIMPTISIYIGGFFLGEQRLFFCVATSQLRSQHHSTMERRSSSSGTPWPVKLSLQRQLATAVQKDLMPDGPLNEGEEPGGSFGRKETVFWMLAP